MLTFLAVLLWSDGDVGGTPPAATVIRRMTVTSAPTDAMTVTSAAHSPMTITRSD